MKETGTGRASRGRTGPGQPEEGPGPQRLDKALMIRGLAPSRSRAAQLIANGAVTVDGRLATKGSAAVHVHQQLRVAHDDQWVSRAAHKLLGAIESLEGLAVSGKRCLDAGASTGGFTQVLLHHGASEVVAVDVGHDQLEAGLRQDPRVENYEGLNLRYVEPGQLGAPFEVIAADLSFISLRLVIGPLVGLAAPGADLVLMVKPQFEIGRQRLGRTGVVTSPDLRREAVSEVVAAAEAQGLQLLDIQRSALPGQDGNLEFFLHLRKPAEGHTASSVNKTALSEAGAVRLDRVDYRDR